MLNYCSFFCENYKDYLKRKYVYYEINHRLYLNILYFATLFDFISKKYNRNNNDDDEMMIMMMVMIMMKQKNDTIKKAV